MSARICWCVLCCFAGAGFCQACGSDSSASGFSLVYPQPMINERVVVIIADQPCDGSAALYDMAGREVGRIGLRTDAPGPSCGTCTRMIFLRGRICSSWRRLLFGLRGSS